MFSLRSLGDQTLGGHYPLTSEATARAIEVANQKKAYVAFHAGSLAKGSNIEGFLEAVELANGNCLHMALSIATVEDQSEAP